ncbi:unnamed protein product [Haemonchus placei]|uniref:Replication protein n=1 Tax=Haemonchus placei TaxID=6290 RepID=A0A0N4WKS5_HAEPC|nr:unnamed protein product [Haemonchus placei]
MDEQIAKKEQSLREQQDSGLRVVKEEIDEESATYTSLRSQLPHDGVLGYEEEPATTEPHNVPGEPVANVADSVRVGQAAREIFELSPLERRLREHRGYNENNWTSAELKALYDGITLYGTTEDALEVIQKNFCTTRTYQQVLAKVGEIRAINVEHREDRMRAEGDFWLATGYRDIRTAPQYIVKPEIDNWEAGIQRVNRQLRSQSDHAVRTVIEIALCIQNRDVFQNALMTTPNDAETPTVYKVTEYRHGRSYGKEQSISWQRLGSFFAGVVRHVRPLPALNALEEVSRTLTDEDKAIIRGWLTNIQMRHLSDFLPDTPYSVDNAAKILLDPLRTRLWNIPEQSSDIEIGSPSVEIEVD